MKTIPLAVVLMAISIAVGCSSPPRTAESEKHRKVAEEGAERARQEERQLRESAKRAMEARLTQLDNQITALKIEWKPTTDKAQRDLQERIKALEAETKDLRERMSTWDDKTVDGWNKLKESTESALAKLERRIDELRSEKSKKK